MKVTIQQAAANALAAYLRPIFPDCEVDSRWVASGKGFPGPDGKAITIVTSGDRQDVFDFRSSGAKLLSSSAPALGQTNAAWQVKVCKQPYQLDVWTTSYPARDDILARLDEVLCAGESALTGIYNPDPFGPGLLLAVGDGWQEFGTTADFDFEGPDLMDTNELVGRKTYRAVIRVDGYFGLALKKSAAAKQLTEIDLLLQETGNPTSHSDTT